MGLTRFDDFNFEEAPQIPAATIRELATLTFLERAEPVIFLGESGTGKSHLAIALAIRLGINNGRAEGLNNVVRLIARRAHGFHSAAAAIVLVMVCCGPIALRLPYERLL